MSNHVHAINMECNGSEQWGEFKLRLRAAVIKSKHLENYECIQTSIIIATDWLLATTYSEKSR